ncbi:MAG: aminoglycoside nucleotidyltransferase [Chloroflexota bacterium]|nr:aminoglycoside nucleotidyltransferase [Chloroflexota bacterium]
MTADDVWSVLDLLDSAGVRVWVDGGWAVDACLGQQTRRHTDLDIVIEQHGLAAAVSALRAADYTDVPRDDTRPWNFVLGDDAGHEVDFHVVEFDDAGRGIYGPPENGDFYPAGSLNGEGKIAGRRVACATPAYLVASHTGYELDENDWHDVSALCERFGLAVPDEYRRRFRYTADRGR